MVNQVENPPTEPPVIPPAQRLQVREDEAAQLLSISSRTVRKLRKRGEIESTGYGKLRRYPVDGLQRWIDRNRTNE
jgi:excisionase family DNA binding protein